MGQYRNLVISLLVLSQIFASLAYYTYPRTHGRANIIIALALGLTWPIVAAWYSIRYAIPFVAILIYRDAKRLLPKQVDYHPSTVSESCNKYLPANYQTGQWMKGKSHD
jgi:hypothetical protein